MRFKTGKAIDNKKPIPTGFERGSLVWMRSIIKRFLVEINDGPEDCIYIRTDHKPGSLAAVTGMPDITSHWLPIAAAQAEEIRDFVEQQIPIPGSASTDEIENLLQDRKTLRRRLNQRRKRDRAELSLRLSLIGGSTGNKRATPREIEDRRVNNLMNQDFMNSRVVIGNGGEVLPLAEVGFTKDKKLSEVYCVLKGIQDYAEGFGMDWTMAVVTLPPEFHPNPTHGKSSWDGTLPNVARRKIGEGFTRIQDRCRKNNILVAGFWTIEAHQDGCPHANFFVYSSDIAQVQQYFRDEFEVTTKSVNFKGGSGYAYEDGEPATFASYCTKYIMKGFSDDAADDPGVLGEEAWASAWSIRRLGFFGIPSREQWRRLRASTTPPEEPHPQLTSLWRAARGGRFGEFIGLMGGFGLKQKARPLSTIHALSKSGRSQVAVGVLLKDREAEKRGLKDMGWAFITKKIGYWLIRKAEADDVPTARKPTLGQAVPTARVLKIVDGTFFSPLHKNLINSAGYLISRVRLNYPRGGVNPSQSPPLRPA